MNSIACASLERMAVPDILVRNIEETLAERIKAIARERNWSLNDVILHILRQGVGLGGEDLINRVTQDIAMLPGAWDPSESAAFRSAVDAFESMNSGPTFVEPDPKKP